MKTSHRILVLIFLLTLSESALARGFHSLSTGAEAGNRSKKIDCTCKCMAGEIVIHEAIVPMTPEDCEGWNDFACQDDENTQTGTLSCESAVEL